jgi:DNA uptake protein ComE-like DNA-binding protein
MRHIVVALTLFVAAVVGPIFAAHAAPAPVVCTPMNVNTASASDLDALPGIGAARAKAIIDGRPYGAVADVRKSIPQAFDPIAKCFKVEKLNVNAATAAELADKLPGIGPVRAAAIVKGRPYAKPEDLVGKGVLTQGVFDGIKPLVTIR